MDTWLVVWLVVALVTTAALLVMLGFLVRHVILLGRTAGRMQADLQPITEELAAASARAADTAAGLSRRASAGTPARRKGRR
jgi:hypothetical protein